MVAFIPSRNLEINYKLYKQTFKTSQFNKNRLPICGLTSEQNYSENEVSEKGTFYG